MDNLLPLTFSNSLLWLHIFFSMKFYCKKRKITRWQGEGNFRSFTRVRVWLVTLWPFLSPGCCWTVLQRGHLLWWVRISFNFGVSQCSWFVVGKRGLAGRGGLLWVSPFLTPPFSVLPTNMTWRAFLHPSLYPLCFLPWSQLTSEGKHKPK